MKQKTLNKLLKDYAKIFENLGFKLNEDFKKDFLHIKRMKTNSTKISFIKADKIKGLKENIKGFKVKPNDQEQREKYFQAVKPIKFLDNLLLKHNKSTLFREIADQFNKDFISNLKNKLVLYKGKDIGEQYSQYGSIVGCMGGCSESWFDVYRDTEGLQLATLIDEGGTMLIRALLWCDKKTNNYWLDKTYEQPAINGDDEVRQEYQKKLLIQVLEHLKDNKSFGFGCAFAENLSAEVVEEIAKDFNTTIYKEAQRTKGNSNRITLSPIIKDFNSCDYEYFPYSDTFQSINRYNGKWHILDNTGDCDYICCRSTEGEDENDTGSICDCCDERVHEDEIHYSEIEGEYLCDECAVYIDERDDTARASNTTYNNYSGEYIWSDDLE
tara:strand:+ start:529 stop:1680 length:1152 start_codon:yes stop_codon:yes gene_type:complete